MRLRWTLGLLLACMAALPLPGWADISVLVAIEPTARKEGLLLSRGGFEAGLSAALHQPVRVTITEDLAEAQRATRGAAYDVYVVPPQIAAATLAQGYELVGATEAAEPYLLVGRAGLENLATLRGKRLFLPLQDSIYSYVARGLLTAGGVSFKELARVEYVRYPQAGLVALSLNGADATLVRRGEWDAWRRDHPGTAQVLATSGAVPGGFSVTVARPVDAAAKAQIARWFATSATAGGMKLVTQRPDAARYRQLAELGSGPPATVPGLLVVSTDEVRRLLLAGAVLADTRSEAEFKASRIEGAVLASYREKSLKDVAFEAAQDDFAALRQLDPRKPTIFMCQGIDSWKSYKASRAALAAGFDKVMWYRGGMQDWERATTPVALGR